MIRIEASEKYQNDDYQFEIMSLVGDYYPEWLSKATLNDSFDWSRSISTDFITFFNHVTLHDSYWIGLNLNNYGELTLIIKLDSFWNKSFSGLKEDEENEHIEGLPFLIIRLQKVINISLNEAEQDMIISQTECVRIPDEEIEDLKNPQFQSGLFPKEFYNRLKACKEVHKTRFIDLGGANVEILHDATIQVLLLHQNGKYIDTGIEKLKPFIGSDSLEKDENGFIKNLWKNLKGE